MFQDYETARHSCIKKYSKAVNSEHSSENIFSLKVRTETVSITYVVALNVYREMGERKR